MKTKEELNALKEQVGTLNEKLKELTEEELAQVIGGAVTVTLGRGYTAEYLTDGSGKIRVHNSNTNKFIIFKDSLDYEEWLNNGGKEELE